MKIQLSYLYAIKRKSLWYFYDVVHIPTGISFAVVLVNVGSSRAKCFPTFTDFLKKRNAKIIDLGHVFDKRA